MNMTTKEKLEYLNNENYIEKDKQIFLKMHKKEQIEFLYVECIDYTILDLKNKKSMYKYPIAKQILINFINNNQ